MKWYSGRYFGIPVRVRLLENDGVEIKGTNFIFNFLVNIMTLFEQFLNIACSILSEEYEPHFRVKIREDK
jgi:hypothetical protein